MRTPSALLTSAFLATSLGCGAPVPAPQEALVQIDVENSSSPEGINLSKDQLQLAAIQAVISDCREAYSPIGPTIDQFDREFYRVKYGYPVKASTEPVCTLLISISEQVTVAINRCNNAAKYLTPATPPPSFPDASDEMREMLIADWRVSNAEDLEKIAEIIDTHLDHFRRVIHKAASVGCPPAQPLPKLHDGLLIK